VSEVVITLQSKGFNATVAIEEYEDGFNCWLCRGTTLVSFQKLYKISKKAKQGVIGG